MKNAPGPDAPAALEEPLLSIRSHKEAKCCLPVSEAARSNPTPLESAEITQVACVKFSNLVMVVWVVSVENLPCQSRP